MTEKCIEAIDAYFKSGNSVPVTRATIKLEEWEAVKEHIKHLEELLIIFKNLY